MSIIISKKTHCVAWNPEHALITAKPNNSNNIEKNPFFSFRSAKFRLEVLPTYILIDQIMFLLKTGTWFTHLSLEWVECPVGSRSITRSLHTSISAYCFGDFGQIYLRWKWDQSSLSVPGRGFCGVSQSVSCHVSLKDTFTKRKPYNVLFWFSFQPFFTRPKDQ